MRPAFARRNLNLLLEDPRAELGVPPLRVLTRRSAGPVGRWSRANPVGEQLASREAGGWRIVTAIWQRSSTDPSGRRIRPVQVVPASSTTSGRVPGTVSSTSRSARAECFTTNVTFPFGTDVSANAPSAADVASISGETEHSSPLADFQVALSSLTRAPARPFPAASTTRPRTSLRPTGRTFRTTRAGFGVAFPFHGRRRNPAQRPPSALGASISNAPGRTANSFANTRPRTSVKPVHPQTAPGCWLIISGEALVSDQVTFAFASGAPAASTTSTAPQSSTAAALARARQASRSGSSSAANAREAASATAIGAIRKMKGDDMSI